MLKSKKMGRPSTPEYRKKTMRYSKVEDSLNEVLKEFESERDKELALKFLKALRS